MSISLIVFGIVVASICAGVAYALSWPIWLICLAYVIGGMIGVIIVWIWLSEKPVNREQLARQMHTKI